jgi:hypothetical protein
MSAEAFPALAQRLQKIVCRHRQEPYMERAKTHPILIVAGFSVLLFTLIGAAALA